MQQDFGWLSVLPPLLTIALAILTRQVYISLIFGIWLGWTILNGWNPALGLAEAVDSIVAVFVSGSNTGAILFTLLMGSVIALTQRAGGVSGFVRWVTERRLVQSRRSAGLMAWVLGLVIFIESNICILVAGTVSRPLFDKLKVSREKLAYILDSTSAPKCMLLPLNAWGAYVISLLAAQDLANPTGVLISSIGFNFYAMLALVLVAVLVWTGKDYGPMRSSEARALQGKLLNEGATPMVSVESDAFAPRTGIPLRALNMVAPIVVMVLMVPTGLVLDGMRKSDIPIVSLSSFWQVLIQGSGSLAVLWAVIAALASCVLLYSSQRLLNLKEISNLAIQGTAPMMPVAAVLVLAFSIGATSRQLGTGPYVAKLAQAAIVPEIVPAVLFLVTCFIAFSTGTSWGTFAIMLPIAVPVAQTMDLSLPLCVAAVLGGGVFGDHCSPISDTSVISSMAAATDHIDHVRTQLPYALTAAAGAVSLFLLFGFIL